jgi:hypothetical protein
MVFETLDSLIHDPQAKTRADSGAKVSAAEFLDQLRFVGMLANQLPLLALSRVPAEKGAAPPSTLEFLRGVRTQFPIVAVSDPNDLLTFPLAPGWPKILGDPNAKVINVRMANANDVVALAAANPGTAHTGYFDNPCVTRLLVYATTNCSRVRIGGLHYSNLGRMQADAGWLFYARSPVSIPAYASVGLASYGAATGISVRNGSLVAQGRASVARTWRNPVRASPNETYAGLGVRLSALTLTVGLDELWNTRTHSATPRWSVGTGW